MSENRPNLRRRMGSFVVKPEPGELLFLHVIQAYCHYHNLPPCQYNYYLYSTIK